MAKTEKEIDQQMILYLSDNVTLILKGGIILDDTVKYKDSFKAEVRNEIVIHYENIVRMVKSIESRKSITQKTKYTDEELKSLKITD